jgi:hypothetical protein
MKRNLRDISNSYKIDTNSILNFMSNELLNNGGAFQRVTKLPRRVFLDTNVIQNLFSFSSFMCDNFMDDEEYEKFAKLDSETKADIEALHSVFQIAQRASFEFVTSPLSVVEFSGIADLKKKRTLTRWGYKLLDYWMTTIEDQKSMSLEDISMDRGVRLYNSGLLDFLPDETDRKLVSESVGLKCDAFMTMDRRSIWIYQDRLNKLGITILRPSEYWVLLRPWAALF